MTWPYRLLFRLCTFAHNYDTHPSSMQLFDIIHLKLVQIRPWIYLFPDGECMTYALDHFLPTSNSVRLILDCWMS